MDVFVRNIPTPATQKQLSDFFDRILQSYNIRDYHVEKLGEKPCAIITFLDKAAADIFLYYYGVPQDAPPTARAKLALHWGGKHLRCMKAKNEPSDVHLKAVEFDKTHRAKQLIDDAYKSQAEKTTTRFKVTTLECGLFDYTQDRNNESQLTFIPHYTDFRQGHVSFGRKEAIIMLGTKGTDRCRVDISYHDCIDMVLGTYEEASVTFNMNLIVPKFYEVKAEHEMAAAMAHLSLGPRAHDTKKLRLQAMARDHEHVAGCCFVYRIYLSDKQQIASIRGLLKPNRRMCPVISQKTRSQYPTIPIKDLFTKLTNELTITTLFGNRPFSLRYQVDRMARNGILPPQRVRQLLPKISSLHKAYGLDRICAAIARVVRERVLPGPTQQAHDFSLGKLEELLETYAKEYDANSAENPYELSRRYAHINLVHKIVVTPAAIFLEGPDPEPTNRVLRKYQRHIDHFARVIFQDEDRAPMRHDPRTDLTRIYHHRFKNVLDGHILTCGRSYTFLGFSHSSLRSQSCWFSSPMVESGSMVFAEQVIKELGEFRSIRVPAKCAARIGQNFTDTNASVRIHRDEVAELPNVERNGRDFSDGVGTISKRLLQSVWSRYGSKKLLKPTALQIRFQGSKGMVALDSRLSGKRLMLRPNMKKYETAATWDLEICGAAFRPLPMVLNRPFIKVMEDLGTPVSAFMDLQNAAMMHLQRMTASNINTSIFMDESDACRATKMADLIRYLGHIGLDYHLDDFIYSVVEMAVVAKLRKMKYKGNIPVEQGVTLYGIMDETGYLQPREIYVVTEKGPEGGKTVLIKNDVIVTRSPALHPGDMQLVNAVDVPETSPLKRLSNVIVFSQHGERDLPSMLGGGDLDGDLYNVIWDPALKPKITYQAADYPRVKAAELDRDVTRKDMSDFFVTFMESDILGMICTTHLQLADQRPAGTLDPDCIKLAGMASTAVDFSKTGIPVNIKAIPKYTRVKPDFMAPSPRVVVSEGGFLDFEDEDEVEDDAFEGLDTERRRTRYYRSEKALGHLYRAIDESKFLNEMQSKHRQISSQQRHFSSRSTHIDLITVVLDYVKKYASEYGLLYGHHTELAQNIRANYEDSLINLLYDFEPSPHAPLSEAEIFSGQILGRQGGAQGKPLREQCMQMRDRFETVVEYVTLRITKGDDAMREAKNLDDLVDLPGDHRYDERELEALPRAIACFDVAVNGEAHRDRKIGELKSFKYVAAAVCLGELDRYRITTFGTSGGLPSM